MSVPAFNQPVVNLPNDAMRYEAEANTTGAAASAAGPAAKGPSFSGPESKSGPVFAAAQPMAQGAAGVQADAARGGASPRSLGARRQGRSRSNPIRSIQSAAMISWPSNFWIISRRSTIRKTRTTLRRRG